MFNFKRVNKVFFNTINKISTIGLFFVYNVMILKLFSNY